MFEREKLCSSSCFLHQFVCDLCRLMETAKRFEIGAGLEFVLTIKSWIEGVGFILFLVAGGRRLHQKSPTPPSVTFEYALTAEAARCCYMLRMFISTAELLCFVACTVLFS